MYKIDANELENIKHKYGEYGDKVEAIKAIRAVSGAGLKDSKDYVEAGFTSPLFMVTRKDKSAIIMEIIRTSARIAELYEELNS